MTMDVLGKKPSSDEGECFMRTVWGWHPLATCLTSLFPDITQKCQHWHTNDGGGLNRKDSIALADAIDKSINDGTIRSYILERDMDLAKLPDEKCDLCGGSGSMIYDTQETIKCTKCAGRGLREAWEKNYHLHINDIYEFPVFLSACGGFEIW